MTMSTVFSKAGVRGAAGCARSCQRIIAPRAQYLDESPHREVAGLDDGACFDLSYRRDRYFSARGELLLCKACLLAEVAQPCCQDCGLFTVAAVSASSTPSGSHTC
jgi:hypothetical protein